MKKLVLLLSVFALTIQMSSATPIDKAEKKRIKKELKGYKKNPEQYKDMITNYKTTIQSNDSTIHVKQKEVLSLNTLMIEQKQQITQLEADLEECKNKPVPVCPVPGSIPSTGTVYKVQFGLYEKFDLSGYFEVSKFIGVEKVDDLNAYVVSYFDTEEQAQKFKADLRKLGMRDAFVSKYTDGARIYEWAKNPKYKGKKAPANLNEALEK
jgi:uncharacterized protein (DUF342 family)